MLFHHPFEMPGPSIFVHGLGDVNVHPVMLFFPLYMLHSLGIFARSVGEYVQYVGVFLPYEV